MHRFLAKGPTAVAKLSYSFEPGTLTMISGPSGSGKSTLLALLALMLTPTEGVVRWGGLNAHTLSDAERARLRAEFVGFVFQDALLDLSRTTIENVLEASALAGIDRTIAESRGRALLERFGVGGLAERRPGQVSGGQAQRIALCRALVREPQVIFADEPTGNLDDASAKIVWDALEDAAEDGATVIAVTHDHQRAKRAERALVLAAP